MKKLILALALTAASLQVQASGRDVAIGVILGAVISQPRVVVVPPPVYIPPYQPAYPVYTYPQQIYAPNPVYSQPGMYPYPRVVISSEPCTYIGQMVMTFDQYNRPVGYRNCQ